MLYACNRTKDSDELGAEDFNPYLLAKRRSKFDIVTSDLSFLKKFCSENGAPPPVDIFKESKG